MDVSNKFYTPGTSLNEITTYQVGVLEAAAHRALRQHKDTLLKEYGLNGVDWYLIGTVHDAGEQGIRSTDLAKQLNVTMGFLTKEVNHLEARGILVKKANAKDARSSYIALNKKYVQTLQRIEQKLRAQLRDSIYGTITRDELQTYLKVIAAFSKLK